MTIRARCLVAMGVAGYVIGAWRQQEALALLSLAVLFWIGVEWFRFQWATAIEMPRLSFSRTVNGRSYPTGVVWAGRTVVIQVDMELSLGSIGPAVEIEDLVPENLQLDDSCDSTNVFHIRRPISKARFEYSARVRAVGELVLPGFTVTLYSPHGMFRTVRFVECSQRFRALPNVILRDDVAPKIKRTNALPQHGIHRLQRSGMGCELLDLRDYVPGDPPKSIAWKVSARRDKLMTRQYDSEVPVRLQLLIDGTLPTRIGGFGCRLIDQITFVAANVARAATSVGDPVGAILVDETGCRRIAAATGEQGFQRLVESLAEFSVNRGPFSSGLSPRMINEALELVGRRFPELLELRLAHVPWSVFPVRPSRRRLLRKRYVLAAVLAAIFDLSLHERLRLVRDDEHMARHINWLSSKCGRSWMDAPATVVVDSSRWSDEKMKSFNSALALCVSHAKDNEIFVVLADLLNCAPSLAHALPSIKMAVARHHRVVVVCPSPTFQRPAADLDPSGDLFTDDEHWPVLSQRELSQALVTEAALVQVHQAASGMRRLLRNAGAKLLVSGQQEAIRTVLAEMELTRTGRASRASPMGKRLCNS